jgi:hypothetical protein
VDIFIDVILSLSIVKNFFFLIFLLRYNKMSNANFRKVEHMAGPLSEMVVADAEISNLNANVSSSVTTSLAGGALTQATVVGYAPTGWIGAAANHNLNKQPGLPQATALTDPQLVVLPFGAVVTNVIANDNGVLNTGAANVSVGTAPTLATATNNALLTAALVGSLVTGAAAGTNLAFGTAGSILSVATGPAGNVLVALPDAAVTAGDLCVIVEYVVQN